MRGYTIVASRGQGDVVGGSNRVTGRYPVVHEPSLVTLSCRRG